MSFRKQAVYKFVMFLVIIFFVIFAAENAEAGTHSNTDTVWTEGVEGGAIYIDEATMTVTDCDASVTSVVVPDGVWHVDSFAFSGCDKLESISVPGSVKRITPSNFSGIKSLKYVYLCEGITEIDENAFSGCYNLENIYLPDSLTKIESSAFRGCSSLTDIELPESITSVPHGLFYGCSNLRNVHLSSNLTRIESWAFLHCNNLEYIDIPDSVTYIGSSAFQNCTSLTEMEIPSSVTAIESSVFSGCNSLKKINIPDGIVKISDSLFSNCSSLENIYIPGSVIYIGDHAFAGCSKLKDFEISEKWESIGDYAFSSCNLSKKLIIPDNYTRIGKGWFANWSDLETVELPEGITSIGENAFKGCSKLHDINLPGNLSEISNGLFSGCNSLKNIEIPDSVTRIGASAFWGCVNLENIIIPECVTEIGASAFMGCDSLTSIDIPAGVKKINELTFYSCDELKSVNFSEGLIEIASQAFQDCNSLKTINFPEGIKIINHSVFYGCSSLESVYIPRSMESIYNGDVFFRCSPDLVIYCYSGSYAESFAKYFSIKYQLLIDMYNYFDLDKNSCAFQIVDEKGTPIQDAIVTYEGNKYSVNGSGFTTLYAVNTEEPSLAVISAEGYVNYSITVTEDKCGKSETIVLYKDTDELKLTSAVLTFNNKKYETLFHDVQLSRSYSSFDIRIDFAVSGDDSEVFRYLLASKDENGRYSPIAGCDVHEHTFEEFLDISDFKAGGCYYFLAIDENQNVILSQPLQIRVTDAVKDEVTYYSFGKGFDIMIPEWMPGVGGKTLSVNMPELPVYMDVKDDKLCIGVNLNIKDLKYDKEIKAYRIYTFKELQDPGYILKQFKKLFEMDEYDPSDNQPFSMDFNIIGYGEGNIDSSNIKVNLYAILKIKFSTGELAVPIPVPFPLYFVYELAANGEIETGIEAEYNSSDGIEKMDIEGSLSGKVGVEGYGALGLPKFLSGGITGEGYVSTKLVFYEGFDNVLFGAKFAVTARFLGMKFNLFPIEGEWYLYDRNAGAEAYYATTPAMYSRALMNEVTDESNYEVIPRDYLAHRTSWYTAMPAVMSYTSDDGTETEDINEPQLLMSGIYTDAAPRMVTVAGKKVLLFLDDMEDRGLLNKSTLMYSVYDDETGTWGIPDAVDNNRTADFSFDAYADDDKLVIVWMDAKEELTDNLTLEEIASKTEISIAEFMLDCNEFMEIETITDNDAFEASPQIVLDDDNRVMVIWSQSEGTDLFGTDSINKIYAAKNINDVWNATEIGNCEGIVLSLDAGRLDGTVAVAYSTESAGYVYSAGTTTTIATENLYNGQFTKLFGEDILTWCQNGNLITQSSADATPTTLFSDTSLGNGSYTIYDGDETYLVLSKEQEGKSNIFISEFDKEAGIWCEPMAITNQANYITDCHAAMTDAGLLITYAQREYLEEAEIVSLYEVVFAEQDNVSIEYFECSSLELAPGAEAEFDIEIKNGSVSPAEGLVLKITDEEGAVVYEETLDIIKGNSSLEKSISFTMGIEQKLQLFTASVLNSDVCMAQSEIEVGHADFAVSVDSYDIGDNNIVNINVLNEGMSSGSGVVNVLSDVDDSMVATFNIENIQPGQGISRSILIHDTVIGDNETFNLRAEFTSDETQTNYGNDIAYFTVLNYDDLEEIVLKPSAEIITDTSIKLTLVDGYEYRMGEDGEWQSSPLFENLKPETEYIFYQRIAATEESLASSVSEELKVTTATEGAIVPEFWGDITNDGTVDMADVAVTKYHIAGYDGYKDLESGIVDLDLSGNICLRDLMILERYLAKWTGYESLPKTDLAVA